MTLPDEELDALAERLWECWDGPDLPEPRVTMTKLAREAARWAEERQGEVVWEWEPHRGTGAWQDCDIGHARVMDDAGGRVRAIRVIATTTKVVG